MCDKYFLYACKVVVMTSKMGRPTVAEPRNQITPVRLSASEKATLQESADLAGVPLGRLIREDALEAAARRLRASGNVSS